jgi:DNA methylase
MACAIEDAGFEVRDQLAWTYGSGFPKGLNVVNNLIILAICQSPENALLAVQCSRSIRAQSSAEREPIAVALAQIRPEGALGLLTEIGGEVALHVPTDTWPSEWMVNIGLSTTLSSKASLDDVCEEASKSIIATVTEATIDQKTLSWLIGLHISANTTPASVTLKNGLQWPAIAVERNSSGGDTRTSAIQIVTALGSAISNPVAKHSGANVNLKPAWEPICLARKPLSEKTVAANVLRWGTGAINVDACRVEGPVPKPGNVNPTNLSGSNGIYGIDKRASRQAEWEPSTLGRFPANLCHDGSQMVLDLFPSARSAGNYPSDSTVGNSVYGKRNGQQGQLYSDSGSAARFFYCAKASKHDRAGSKHPTVKPVKLMQWLCRMLTPPGGTVLDPFAGSGTTGAAALLEGFRPILIEREPEYQDDIRKRMAAFEPALNKSHEFIAS